MSNPTEYMDNYIMNDFLVDENIVSDLACGKVNEEELKMLLGNADGYIHDASDSAHEGHDVNIALVQEAKMYRTSGIVAYVDSESGNVSYYVMIPVDKFIEQEKKKITRRRELRRLHQRIAAQAQGRGSDSINNRELLQQILAQVIRNSPDTIGEYE